MNILCAQLLTYIRFNRKDALEYYYNSLKPEKLKVQGRKNQLTFSTLKNPAEI
jgi:hypothetical protein